MPLHFNNVQEDFYLNACPYMVGITEAWVINRFIFVSPALFQLLTDREDFKTSDEVAKQLSVKYATYEELMALRKKMPDASFDI